MHEIFSVTQLVKITKYWVLLTHKLGGMVPSQEEKTSGKASRCRSKKIEIFGGGNKGSGSGSGQLAEL
jgi:hypothetical protein